ncbi:hypothetical protein FF38_14410 [Lucilia cuprina]|uniref:Uncharacterized protein n=1 Tax=Lucilia cuprina TaxID=7375 RepID=A0A0L0CG48_LUCCU|nr:hypothetical protein FF38_14410 [Lucilia cuprina]
MYIHAQILKQPRQKIVVEVVYIAKTIAAVDILRVQHYNIDCELNNCFLIDPFVDGFFINPTSKKIRKRYEFVLLRRKKLLRQESYSYCGRYLLRERLCGQGDTSKQYESNTPRRQKRDIAR